MTTNSLIIVSITDLMRETGIAHAEATKTVNRQDPEWPLWFAEYLQEPLSGLFEIEFTKSQFVFCLITVERERMATQANADWPRFYAEYFTASYAGTDTPKEDELILYMMPGCPFCHLVMDRINELDIDVELRDITANPEYYQELIAERKRATVPVLFISSPNGETRWMPESRDIVQYLDKTYA